MNERFGKNTMAKILSLILATVLWVYVMNEQNPPVDMSFTVQPEVRNVAAGLVLTDGPGSVRIRVRGPRRVLAGLQGGDIRAYIDLSNVGEGTQTLPVRGVVPAGLELLEISPDKVTVTLDAVVSKTVPVRVRTTGNLPPGSVLGNIAVSPSQVLLQGPRRKLDAVDQVTAVVDVSDQKGDFTVPVSVKVVARDGQELSGVTAKPDTVQVTVPIRSQAVKAVDVKPLVTGQPAAGYSVTSITTEPSRVDLQGLPESLAKVDALYTTVVNIDGLNKDGVFDAKLQVPAGLTPAVETVKVRVTVGPATVKQ